MVGAAVVDPHDQRLAVPDIGDAGVAWDRQRRMGSGQRGHVEDLAIGGQPAVEVVAIPGSHALGAIVRILFRHVDPACDGVGLADAVGSPALRHGLPERHHARARGDAIFGIDAAGEFARTRRNWQGEGTLPRQQYHAPPGRSFLAVESPSSPITIFSGRLPTLKRCGLTPRCGPPPHHVVKISQPEHGGNGVRSRVVNEWLLCASVDLRALRFEFTVYAPFVASVLCRLQTICCTKSSLTTDLRFLPVNLFDCATVESFCGLQGRKGFVR